MSQSFAWWETLITGIGCCSHGMPSSAVLSLTPDLASESSFDSVGWFGQGELNSTGSSSQVGVSPRFSALLVQFSEPKIGGKIGGDVSRMIFFGDSWESWEISNRWEVLKRVRLFYCFIRAKLGNARRRDNYKWAFSCGRNIDTLNYVFKGEKNQPKTSNYNCGLLVGRTQQQLNYGQVEQKSFFKKQQGKELTHLHEKIINTRHFLELISSPLHFQEQFFSSFSSNFWQLPLDFRWQK